MSSAQMQAWMDASPAIAFMRLCVVSADPDGETIEVHAPMRPEFERGIGTGQWHGGPIAAVIDTVGDFALMMLLGRGLPTVNFRVDYFRPAVNTDLRAVARVRRNGRSVGVSDIDVFDDRGALVAIGRATYATAGG